MKRILFYSGCFFTVLVISLLAHFPASFALKYLPPINGLKIQTAQGTIWDGSVQRVIWRGENFGEVDWQFEASKLFQGKVNYQLRFGRGSDDKLRGKGSVGIGFSGPYAENLVISLPAEKVLKRMPLPLPVTVEGNIELSLKEYVYAQPWCQSATGSLVWHHSKVSSPLGELAPGSVITDFSCSESNLSANGVHDSPQIAAGFEGEMDANRRYTVKAWFKPNAEFPTSMKSQLTWLGNPNNKGEYPFTYAGKLN